MAVEEQDLKRLVAAILNVDRFQKQDLRKMIPAYNKRDMELAIWLAREDVRRTAGIVFGVTPGHPGVFRRLTPHRKTTRAMRATEQWPRPMTWGRKRAATTPLRMSARARWMPGTTPPIRLMQKRRSTPSWTLLLPRR